MRMQVTILSQQECAFCEQAKNILSRLQGEFDLELNVVDMASAEGAELAERGQIMFPPGIFLDGEAFSYGRLSERKLRNELKRRAASPA